MTEQNQKQGMKEREAALSVLLSVFEKGEYLDRAMERELSRASAGETGQTGAPREAFSARERAFLLRLCEGCAERRLTLDFVLDGTASVPVKKQKPVIRTLLRMGAYQILYMDQVSDAAAVSSTVALVRGPFASLKGVVNGVLRSIARNRREWEEKIAHAPAEVRFSVPAWILDLWTRERGEAAAEQMTAALAGGAPVCIRANEARISKEALAARLAEEGFDCTPAEGLPALYPARAAKLFSTQAYRNGLFYAQDAAAMQVIRQALQLADPLPKRVLDLCAAPGGKALQLAEGIAAAGGTVTARDKTGEKVRRIRENAGRLGITNLTAEVHDALTPDPAAEGAFDLVLCDLPCSGLGVLSRKPDIRCRVVPSDLCSLAALQKEMLGQAAFYVADGGMLVYSTCTVSRAENEENAAWFEETHPAFEKLKEEQILPRAGRNDGAYYCIFRRRPQA